MCPPGVDQTTRTAPKWQIVAPRLKQHHRLRSCSDYHTSTPKAVLFRQNDAELPWDAWGKLVTPSSSSSSSSSSANATHDGTTAAAKLRRGREAAPKPAMLERLPAELIAHLFYLLASPHPDTPDRACSDRPGASGLLTPSPALDLTALALCSSTLFAHFLRHLALHGGARGAWAGVELACTGTWLTELPASFTEKGLAPRNTEVDWRPGRGRSNRGMCQARRWNWNALSSFKDEVGIVGERAWMAAFERVTSPWNVRREGESVFDEAVRREMRGLMWSILGAGAGSPEGKGWVLRNLDKKEIAKVLPPVIETSTGTIRPCFLDSLGERNVQLDDALLMRICWNNAQTGNKQWQKKGAWAGDRFDVVEYRGDGDVWKDVTEELASEATELRHAMKPEGPSEMFYGISSNCSDA